jgi:hypothetical protein
MKNSESFACNGLATFNDYLTRSNRAKVVLIHPQFVVSKKASIS